MLAAGAIESCRQQKRLALALFAAALALVIMLVALRFIPRINDGLAGQPEYMRAIATNIAQRLPWEAKIASPIIVSAGDTSHCQGERSTLPSEFNEILYLITYAEQTRSVCFTACIRAAAGSTAPNQIVVTAEQGENYGRPLGPSATVIPAQYHLLTFSSSYLSTLHWRDKTDPYATQYGVGESYRSRPLTKGTDITLNMIELRATVARRHDRINHWLSWFLSISLGLTVLVVFRITSIYASLLRLGRLYGFKPRFLAFLTHDLVTIAREAHHQYVNSQDKVYADLRIEHLLERYRQEIRQTLESFPHRLSEKERVRYLEECRQTEDPEKMKELLSEVKDHLSEKTPEERLDLLLESSKAYCTSEEFSECRLQTLATFKQKGFREARQHVIAMHYQFRLRAQELANREEDAKGL